MFDKLLVNVSIEKSDVMRQRTVTYTVWKMSVFGVILARIFPHLDWLQRDTPIFTPNVRKYGPE